MRKVFLIALAVSAISCGRKEPAPRVKADPPPRPQRIDEPEPDLGSPETDAGGSDCPGAFEAFRYDPDRECRYAWQTLCGLQKKPQLCVIARESARETATGDCWHFKTCPPEGFEPDYGSCSSKREDPFCPEVDVDCTTLGVRQCNERDECRTVYSEQRYIESLGCWEDSRQFLRCEDADACSVSEPDVQRIGDACRLTDACEPECADCAPCPAIDEAPPCADWQADVTVARVVADSVLERFELLETEPPAICQDAPPQPVGSARYLGWEGVVDSRPNEPQTIILYPLPGDATTCQLTGGWLSVVIRGPSGETVNGYIPEITDCSDLYLMVKIRMSRESGSYSVRVDGTDGCGATIATPTETGVEWTHE